MEKAAEEMECGAQRFLFGLMHQRGLYDTPIDKARAFELYEQSAALDYPRGIYAVGMCYWNGTGTVQDRQVGRIWLKKAADMGQARAAHILAIDMIQTGYARNSLNEFEGLLDTAAKGGILEALTIKRALSSGDIRELAGLWAEH